MDGDVQDPTIQTGPDDPGDDGSPDVEGHSLGFAVHLTARKRSPETEQDRMAKRMIDEKLPPITKRFPRLRDDRGS